MPTTVNLQSIGRAAVGTIGTDGAGAGADTDGVVRDTLSTDSVLTATPAPYPRLRFISPDQRPPL